MSDKQTITMTSVKEFSSEENEKDLSSTQFSNGTTNNFPQNFDEPHLIDSIKEKHHKKSKHKKSKHVAKVAPADLLETKETTEVIELIENGVESFESKEKRDATIENKTDRNSKHGKKLSRKHSADVATNDASKPAEKVNIIDLEDEHKNSIEVKEQEDKDGNLNLKHTDSVLPSARKESTKYTEAIQLENEQGKHFHKDQQMDENSPRKPNQSSVKHTSNDQTSVRRGSTKDTAAIKVEDEHGNNFHDGEQMDKDSHQISKHLNSKHTQKAPLSARRGSNKSSSIKFEDEHDDEKFDKDGYNKSKQHSDSKQSARRESTKDTAVIKIEEDNGAALLFAVKSKKKAAALKLVEEGANIHFVDETKRNVIHYAAQAGYDDIIMKLVALGGNVKLLDCNYETPLHKAARSGHDTTVVLLVANGAEVDTLNKEGKSPLELAVMGKHVKVIEVLFMFGANLAMQDWTWLEEALQSKQKNDEAIIDMMWKHNERLPGFKHGGIAYKVTCLEPDKSRELDKMNMAVEAKKSSSQFPFYCCKLHVEYTDVKALIKENEELFSDIYECRSWSSLHKVFTINIKLTGVPKCNETINVVSPDGNIGHIDSILRNEEENCTKLTVTVTIKHNSITTFMFVAVEKPEVFSVSKEAVTIQPQMEPEAEIDIPSDTFDSPGDLLFNVVETKDLNGDADDSDEEPSLVTNVLDLSMSNHEQPKKPIDMKLPMHAKVDENAEIVILASSKEYPEKMEDWEIVEAKKDGRKKCAAFKIKHFSIYTGVTKTKLDEDMIAVTTLIQKALNNERQVEFFILVKTLSKNEYAVVIECALQRKAKQRRRFWRKKNYEQQEVEMMSHTVQVNSWFRVKFEGNIKRVGVDQAEMQKLMFHPNRDNFQIYSVEMVDTKNPPIGRVKIELQTEKEQEPIKIIDPGTGCTSGKTTLIPRDPIIEYYELTSLPVHLKPPPPEDETVPDQAPDNHDPTCTISTLRKSSLMQLQKRLNMDEIEQLAIQLKVCDGSEIAKLSTELTRPEDFLRHIMRKWRGSRPFISQIDFLVNALVGIDKQYEADEIRLAKLENREIRFA